MLLTHFVLNSFRCSSSVEHSVLTHASCEQGGGSMDPHAILDVATVDLSVPRISSVGLRNRASSRLFEVGRRNVAPNPYVYGNLPL